MADIGKIKIKAKVKEGVASVKSLITHPMETGTRRDADNNLIPAHYIETVVCEHNGEAVLTAQWGPSVSKDPYFAFMVNGAGSGDTIRISWTDNQGKSASNEITLK